MPAGPPPSVAALALAARTFAERCDTLVPLGDVPAVERRAPLWLFDLAEAASQFASRFGELMRSVDDLRYVSHRHRLSHGIDHFDAIFGTLMDRWGWPRGGNWGQWWAGFLDSLFCTPDGQPKFARPDIPSYIPVKVIADGRGGYKLVADLSSEIDAGESSVARPAVGGGIVGGDGQWIVSDVTAPGGPPMLFVLTRADAKGSVGGFLLNDPTIPTMAAGELKALRKATTLIDSGLTDGPDAPAGPAHSQATAAQRDERDPDEGEPIPPERLTRPMGVAEAAKLMEYKGKPRAAGRRLARAMQAGSVRFVRINRQTYKFDIEDFPAESREEAR
jgi:hypothetical protein